jgi:GTP cyclohydrolase I
MRVAHLIQAWDDRRSDEENTIRLYGVPNGGIPALLAVYQFLGRNCSMVETVGQADVIVDDLIDAGHTRDRYAKLAPGKPFFVLLDKQKENLLGTWVSFPWERMQREDGPQDAVRRLIQYIGDDPLREGLKETPDRVVRSYAELFAGYKQNPADVMKVFEDGACDEMVLLQDISCVSTCEHHLLPFIGTAHVAYIPDKRVIGVSKLARIVDIYARRLQVQERLTQQITAALDEHLKPKGSACVIQAQHLCMACRGVGKQNAVMKTSSLSGAFKDDAKARAEFFAMICR